MTRFKDPLPSGARTFESRLQVQWADVDVAGIMYFAAYPRFAEYAEMQLFEELGFPYDRVFSEYDFWLPRVRVETEYYAPALMNDWLRMRTHVVRVGGSSIRWHTVVFNERTGEAGALMTFVVAAIDATTKKSRPLPAPIRNALVACMAPASA
ncbi:MAG: acyl-CoA thioesterase [Candidatus Eremiobacteraeota bacterium]|nr:acyl-CoA thioesterase [Candidatus Eremiobacteraeota bacterium]MBV9056743.1 acyl-CoA thioesterase [Candidatus Eremiobacteraeota bacterium]MBV9700256.1 acyl-CoA thioesterase [Candidatus Eremiobacteraeota bacterium]